MAKYLRIIEFKNITPNDLDGLRYKLRFEIGKVDNDRFVSENTYQNQIEISRTLQTIWGLSDEIVIFTVGSICVHNALELAKKSELGLLNPIVLNTFNSGKTPPTDKVPITAGSIIPFPEKVVEQAPAQIKIESSFLSEDISEIRDNINALSKNLLGGRLLLVKQERALFDMYKSATSEAEFVLRISSLAGFLKLIDLELLRKFINKPNDDRTGWRQLIQELLTQYSDAKTAENICNVFRKIDDLRQLFPIHGDNLKSVLPAHKFFGIKYPILNYTSAWEAILIRYFNAMREIRGIFQYHFDKDNTN